MAKDIVDVAIGELGYKEQGNNRTKYGAWYGMNGAICLFHGVHIKPGCQLR